MNTKSILQAIVVASISFNSFADVCSEGVKLIHTKNYKQALEKLNSISNTNNKVCIFGISVVNYFGYGVPQNYDKAFAYAKQAAQLGQPEAQGFLSGMYAEGQGTEKNLVKAHMWANIASAQGIDFAKEVRESVTQKLSAIEINEAQAKASLCKEKNYLNCE